VTDYRPPSLPDEQEISPAQQRRRSRYTRPRRYFSWVGLILGLALGVSGGLFYTWNIDPVEEFDTAPWQLNERDRAHYIVAVMLNYEYDGNLARTVRQLVDLRLPGNDPIQHVAEVACDLARSGYVDSSSGLRAIRSMIRFYQGQGKSGCAEQLVPFDEQQAAPVVEVVLPTPTLVPPATKTPTPPGTAPPSATPAGPFVPTSTPARAFELLTTNTFCSVELSGLIEVRVVNFNGQGIPGQPVRVRWDGGSSTFFTGLKPERGPDYADFQMEAGRAYTIEMPGLSNPSANPLTAVECFTEGGQRTIRSYRVVFRGG
jgi:hypothetical protein